MITPLTFLDELERAFPELADEIAEARTRFDSATVAVDVYRWVGLLAALLQRAIEQRSDALVGRCFDFIELLYREGNAHVLTPVSTRIFERLGTPELRAACRKHGGPYTLMAHKFDAEGIAAD